MRIFILTTMVFVGTFFVGCSKSSAPERPLPASSDRAEPAPGEEPETMEDMR